MRTRRVVAAAALAAACTFARGAPAQAAEVVFAVGGDAEKGKAAAEGAGGQWAKSLTKGFDLAAQAINAGGERTVVLKVAAGDYDGDLGSGAYKLPSFRNKDATFRIEGGYAADFAARDPFRTPSRIVTTEKRGLPLWYFFNSRPQDQDVLRALTIDGFLFDPGNSNAYDKKTNSLIKGSSSTHVMVAFNMLMVDALTVQHCVFLNGAQGALTPNIRPASGETKVRFYDDIIMNTLIPVTLVTASGKHQTALIEVDRCSFLINWGFNPDPNTSNPCALEVGSKDAAKAIRITNNLFYANFGGAILALHKSLPPLTVRGNNFVGNGLLHGQAEPGAVAMVVDAGGKKQPISVEQIEETKAVPEAGENVSVPPGIPLSLGDPKSVDAEKVKAEPTWENQLRRLLGKPLQGGRVEIKDFAPRKEYDPANPPFPTADAAKKYGASPDLVK